ASGAHQGFPVVGAEVGTFGQEQHFDGSACFGTVAQQACGNDTALVGDKQVARTKILPDVAKVPVFQGARGSLDDEETRGVAVFKRRLSNQLWWQVIIEVANF